jgi:hypothetical protein
VNFHIVTFHTNHRTLLKRETRETTSRHTSTSKQECKLSCAALYPAISYVPHESSDTAQTRTISFICDAQCTCYRYSTGKSSADVLFVLCFGNMKNSMQKKRFPLPLSEREYHFLFPGKNLAHGYENKYTNSTIRTIVLQFGL